MFVTEFRITGPITSDMQAFFAERLVNVVLEETEMASELIGLIQSFELPEDMRWFFSLLAHQGYQISTQVIELPPLDLNPDKNLIENAIDYPEFEAYINAQYQQSNTTSSVLRIFWRWTTPQNQLPPEILTILVNADPANLSQFKTQFFRLFPGRSANGVGETKLALMQEMITRFIAEKYR